MSLVAITGNTDLTGPSKPKRLKSLFLCNTGAAGFVNVRDGSVTGTRLIQVPLPIGSTTPSFVSLDLNPPFPVFPTGIYVEILTATVVGSVDVT
jgi:hypothetical protein